MSGPTPQSQTPPKEWDVFAPPPGQAKERSYVPIAATVLAGIVLIWGGTRFFRGHTDSAPSVTNSTSGTSQQAAAVPPGAVIPPAATAPPVTTASRSPKVAQSPSPPTKSASRRQTISGQGTATAAATGSPSVVHEEIPDIPRSARDTIHGHIKVAVRVKVDGAGNVIGQTLENPGPSKYFAHLASDAARKWKFAAADAPQSREWLLRFEFSRSGATGHAVAPRS